jgi:GH43 family beta-xylosidase
MLCLYSYYTAGTSGTFDNQRLHVLEGSSTELWASTWKYSSRITLPGRDGWAIDATIMFLGGKQYLVYSSWDGANQCLWIA